jgi:hypothetical protein
VRGRVTAGDHFLSEEAPAEIVVDLHAFFTG